MKYNKYNIKIGDHVRLVGCNKPDSSPTNPVELKMGDTVEVKAVVAQRSWLTWNYQIIYICQGSTCEVEGYLTTDTSIVNTQKTVQWQMKPTMLKFQDAYNISFENVEKMTPEKSQCTCPSRTLFLSGCQCGYTRTKEMYTPDMAILLTKQEEKVFQALQSIQFPYKLFSHYKLPVPGHAVPYCCDFAYPNLKIDIEVERITLPPGVADGGWGAKVTEYQRQRDTVLKGMDWVVLRLTKAMTDKPTNELQEYLRAFLHVLKHKGKPTP